MLSPGSGKAFVRPAPPLKAAATQGRLITSRIRPVGGSGAADVGSSIKRLAPLPPGTLPALPVRSAAIGRPLPLKGPAATGKVHPEYVEPPAGRKAH